MAKDSVYAADVIDLRNCLNDTSVFDNIGRRITLCPDRQVVQARAPAWNSYKYCVGNSYRPRRAWKDYNWPSRHDERMSLPHVQSDLRVTSTWVAIS